MHVCLSPLPPLMFIPRRELQMFYCGHREGSSVSRLFPKLETVHSFRNCFVSWGSGFCCFVFFGCGIFLVGLVWGFVLGFFCLFVYSGKPRVWSCAHEVQMHFIDDLHGRQGRQEDSHFPKHLLQVQPCWSQRAPSPFFLQYVPMRFSVVGYSWQKVSEDMTLQHW